MRISHLIILFLLRSIDHHRCVIVLLLQVIVTCVPFTFTVYILDSWPFGLLLCKLSECAKDISIGVSVFTLTALSADRFFAIVDPMRKLHVTGIHVYILRYFRGTKLRVYPGIYRAREREKKKKEDFQ